MSVTNENLITNEVVNWSHTNNLLRLKIPIGVGYSSDIKQAMALMLEAAGEAPRVLADPKPACLLMGFGDSSLNFQVRLWIRDPQNGVHNVKSQILLGVVGTISSAWHRTAFPPTGLASPAHT